MHSTFWLNVDHKRPGWAILLSNGLPHVWPNPIRSMHAAAGLVYIRLRCFSTCASGTTMPRSDAAVWIQSASKAEKPLKTDLPPLNCMISSQRAGASSFLFPSSFDQQAKISHPQHSCQQTTLTLRSLNIISIMTTTSATEAVNHCYAAGTLGEIKRSTCTGCRKLQCECKCK